MAIQYPYPETGWSTGNMRMSKMGPMRDTGRDYRELEGQRKKKEARVAEADIGAAASRLSDHAVVNTMERLHESRKEAQGIKSLTTEQWNNWQQQFPQGQIIPTDHPQINDVAKTHDLYSIPNQYEKFLFMNPKQTQTKEGG